MFGHTLSRRRPVGFNLDIPAGGWVVRCRQTIQIAGWYANSSGLPAEQIFVRIGRRTVLCTPGARPDVAKAYPGAIKDVRCGFSAHFTTRAGWKLLKVYAQERGGTRLLAVRLVHFCFESPSPVLPTSPRLVMRTRLQKREELKRGLGAFLRERETLAFESPSVRPGLSILIILWNQAELTLACLRSLQGALAGIDAEILIADNASTDATVRLCAALSGARIFRRPCNEGFLTAANFLAGEARGEHLLFLNNDATVEPEALRRALASLHRRPGIGAVGARVILPHGVVQEAGNTIWRDGTGAGYGRGRAPEDASVLDWKYTDYVSGVFLLTRRADFIRLGGFDPRLAPAYCEDVDYCIKLWKDGLAVVCDPSVVVHHFEFGSSVRTESAIALQLRNAAILRQNHGEWLAGQPVPAREVEESRFCRFSAYRGHVLLLDDRVPDFYTGSGAPRAVALMDVLLAKNWKITYCAAGERGAVSEWFRSRYGSEIHVISALDRTVFERWVKLHGDTLDVVFVSRPHNMKAFGSLLSAVSADRRCPRLVYDAEAIYALRDISAARLHGEPMEAGKAERMMEEELGLAGCADAVVTVSPSEAARFREYYAGEKPVEVLAHTAGERFAGVAGFEGRSGLLFVGRLAEDGSPNVDSMLWFIREVYPLLAGKLDGPIRIVGDARALPAAMLRLPGVEILGPVGDVAPYYGQARVFLAPTRFAAGIPLKVVEAARYQLPAVCTSLLAGQLEWRHGDGVLVADTPEAFARECLRLHGDPGLWASLSRAAGECYDRQFSAACFTEAVERIFSPPMTPVTVPSAEADDGKVTARR